MKLVKTALAFISLVIFSTSALAENDETEGGVSTPLAVTSTQACLPGSSMWAVITSAGSFVRGTPGTTVLKNGIGRYTVTFPLVITRAGYQGTLADPASIGTEPPGSITITGRALQAQALWIATYNQAGANTDRDFHVVVHC